MYFRADGKQQPEQQQQTQQQPQQEQQLRDEQWMWHRRAAQWVALVKLCRY